MFGRRYIDNCLELITSFRDSQGEVMQDLAAEVAKRIQAGGALHHFDTGHMKREPIRRAGGFLGLHALDLDFEVNNAEPAGRDCGRSAIAQSYFYDREELAPILLDKSYIQEGDVLIQVSNSGKEAFTVGVAAEAKKRGVYVLALTSVEFSKSLEAKHSSGKRLFEIADGVLDMGATLGDAMVEIPGLDAMVGPSSGVLTAVSIWALMTEIAEALVARGIKPAVYKSVNLPDGFEFNAAQERRYREFGI